MRPIDAIKRSLLPAAGMALAAATVSGCGQQTVVGANRTLRLALTEYRVVPQTVRARPGLLAIVVRNEGRLTHNLTLSRGTTVLAQTVPLSPGARAELVLTLTPGRYLIASTLLSDQTLGEYGTLTVG
jgi:hypothetical protein